MQITNSWIMVFRIINELAEEELIVLSGKNIAVNDAVKLIGYTKE